MVHQPTVHQGMAALGVALPETTSDEASMADNESVATGSGSRGKGRRGKRSQAEYQPSSPWSGLGYGLGVLLPFVVLPLLPISPQHLVMGFVLGVIGLYSSLCLWGILRGLFVRK